MIDLFYKPLVDIHDFLEENIVKLNNWNVLSSSVLQTNIKIFDIYLSLLKRNCYFIVKDSTNLLYYFDNYAPTDTI